MPWNSPSIASVGFPRNFSTGKPYSAASTSFCSHRRSSNRPGFSPYLQAQERGGQVRKGEKGFPW